MLIIDHKQEAVDMLDRTTRYGTPLEAQAHATLALVNATEKQTAALALILVAMQTGMTNEQRGEFNRSVIS